MKLLQTLLLLAAIFTIGLARAPFAVADEPGESVASIAQKLNLTAEQKAKVSQIVAARDVSCQKYPVSDKRRTCMLIAAQQADAQIHNLLSPEQLPQFEALRQERIELKKTQRGATKGIQLR